jgi:hypothetical protein
MNKTDITAATSAIERSIDHNEIVRFECADPLEVLGWINAHYDDVDYAKDNHGNLDVWGKDSGEWGKRNGEDFRVRICAE